MADGIFVLNIIAFFLKYGIIISMNVCFVFCLFSLILAVLQGWYAVIPTVLLGCETKGAFFII